MARGPLTEEEVIADSLVLNVETVGLSDEQFFQLCLDNRELHLELTAQRELVIMTLPGGKTGRRNEIICRRLGNWAEQDGTGITNHVCAFDSVHSSQRREAGSRRLLAQARAVGHSHR